MRWFSPSMRSPELLPALRLPRSMSTLLSSGSDRMSGGALFAPRPSEGLIVLTGFARAMLDAFTGAGGSST
jgi:hypothetical protein